MEGAELICGQDVLARVAEGVLLDGTTCFSVCTDPIWALRRTGGLSLLGASMFSPRLLSWNCSPGDGSAGRRFPKLGTNLACRSYI